jgi:hypothetical protein
MKLGHFFYFIVSYPREIVEISWKQIIDMS